MEPRFQVFLASILWLASTLPAGDASAAGRYFVDGRPVPDSGALKDKVPACILNRIHEIETELSPLGGQLAFHYADKPADLLLVSTLEADVSAARLKDAVAAYSLVRQAIVETRETKPASVEPDESTPWHGIAMGSSPFVIRIDQAPSSIRLETTPVLNRGRDPVAGAVFDVEITNLKPAAPDDDAQRPGYQRKTDEDGIHAVPISLPKTSEPRVGVVRVESVQNPQVRAETEVHLTFSDSPHFPTIFLLHDSEKEYQLVLDYLALRYPQGGSWASRPADVKLKAKARTAFFFAYPESVVLPDRAKSRTLEKWSTRNQLVHQLVHPVVYEHFGSLPHWVEEGLAWHVEESLTGEFQAFCGHEGYVFDIDNSRWMEKLKGVGSLRELKLAEAFDYHGELIDKTVGKTRPERTFDVMKNAKAFAVVRFCLADDESRRKFPRFLGALASEWAAKGQIPGERQLEVVKLHYGPDVETAILAFIQQSSGGRR